MSHIHRKKLPAIVLFALCILPNTSCHHGFESRGFDFVWPEEARDSMNYTMAFQLDKPVPVSKAVLQICASNAYMVFQNDEMIAFGPARTAHGHIRMDEISLKGLDRETRITVDVIGNNIDSFCYVDEKPYFAGKIIADGKVIATSRDFSCFHLDDRIQRVERFSYQRDFAEAYRMSEDRSHFYLGDRTLFRKYPVSSTEKPHILKRYAPYPRYDRIKMTFVEDGRVFVDEAAKVWNPRFIRDISDTTSKGFTREKLEICVSDSLSKLFYRKNGNGARSIEAGTYTVADAGLTKTGWFDLRLRVKDPTLLYVIFDEIDFYERKRPGEGLNISYKRNDCVGAVRYELAPGEYHLVNFEQLSARYLKFVCVRGALDIVDTKLISFENPDMYKLQFECEDDSLNMIVRASQNTLAQNAVDLFTDCPQRERGGYLCDAFFSSRTEFLMTGNNTIDRCFLENYALCPQSEYLPKGMIPMCYPADHISGQHIPNWSMWYVLQLYDYFKRTADREIIEMSRSKVEGLIEFFKKYESPEGLLENLENWVFVEWSDANKFVNGINFPSNMVYSNMLICAGELYGDKTLIEKGESLKKKIAGYSFNGQFFEDNLIREDGKLMRTGNVSETCQYYAFFCGIADKESYPELYKTLYTCFGPDRDAAAVFPEVRKSNAFVGNYLRLEILRREHRTREIISECKQFFYYMAERTGTMWEHSKPQNSLDHGFASYAANFVIEAVTGISDYDAATNTLQLTEPGLKLDCKATIPLNGKEIIIVFDGDDRNINVPEGVNCRSL